MKSLGGIQKLLNDFVGLLYPQLCIACFDEHPLKNQLYCYQCSKQLIYTDLDERRENEFEEHFFGRIPLERGACVFIYRKDTAIQGLLHQFKYKGKSEVGFQIGLDYGNKLLKGSFLNGIDAMVPVPLHWKREKKRGYNQSLVFAQGLHQVTNIPIIDQVLIKTSATESQTRMGRSERVENVSSTFEIKNPEAIKSKHILLIDDVLTTGATLEACALQLLPHDCKISMLTIAMGRM